MLIFCIVEQTAETVQLQESHIKEAFTNQERLRQNIMSLEKVKNQSLIDRYCRDLDREEDELIAARKVIDQMRKDFKACADTVAQKANALRRLAD